MIDQKLENFIKTVWPSTSRYCIYDTEDGKYILFSKYSVQRIDENIVVIRLGDAEKFIFSNMKNAVSWIVLDSNKKFYEANRIIELDFRLNSVIVEQKIYQNIKKKTKDHDRYMLMLDKIDHNKSDQTKFLDELNKYIIMADSCQQQGFENELKRSSRKQKE